MIVDISGGKGGLKDYLEHGKKQGREAHRNELDQRVALFGDLDVFEMATSHEGKGQKYDHVTLSFSETNVADEMLKIAVNEFRAHALAAWPESERHRIAFYAEAHRPRILRYTHSETGKEVDRLIHIHVAMGKRDLLTGKAIEPFGFLGAQSDNLKYIDAWQESFNARHGFASPKDNPNITAENGIDILARYSGSQPDALDTFNDRKSELEVALQQEIVARNIITWEAFGTLLSAHGEVSTMRQGWFNECYRIKLSGMTQAIRLQGAFFQRQFIERPTSEKKSIISAKAKTAYLEQMPPRKTPEYLVERLQEWNTLKAREHRYLHTGSKFYKEIYQPADAQQRVQLLNEIEREMYGIQSSTAAQNRTIAPARNRVPGMPIRNLDGIQHRTEMLLRGDARMDVRAEFKGRKMGVELRQADARAGRGDSSSNSLGYTGAGESGPAGSDQVARQTVDSGGLPRVVVQPSSVLARVMLDQRERYEQAEDKERYAEIRKHLDCTQLLHSLSHSHGLNPALYHVRQAQDAAPRIQCGSRVLTSNDFLTKELGLAWQDAAPLLRRTYEQQIGQEVTKPRERAAPSALWEAFKAERLAEKLAATQRLKRFDGETKARRTTQFAALKTEEKQALKGLTGVARKAAQSLEKFRAATVNAEFKEARKEARKSIQPLQAQAWRLFLQARAQTGNEEALAALRKLDDTARAVPAQSITGTIHLSDDEDEKRRRRARESLAALLTTFAHTVELNGDITYRQNSHAVLRDEGQYLAVLDQNSEEAIAAGLLIAREKFGRKLMLTGSPEFQHRVVAMAVAQGIPIEFVDPQLEAKRLQLIAENCRAARTSPAREKVADKPTEVTVPEQPTQRAAAPLAQMPAPEAPITQDRDRVHASARLAARAALAADLQVQGREINQVKEGTWYVGQIREITHDGFMVQSVNPTALVIHELALLDGEYAVGQAVELMYEDGRGTDRLQDFEAQHHEPPDVIQHDF